MTGLTKRCLHFTVAAALACCMISCPKSEEIPVVVPEIDEEPETTAEEEMTKKFRDFLETYVAEARKLDEAASLAAWTAYTTGKDEQYTEMEKTQMALKMYHSDPEKFKLLSEIYESNAVEDLLLKRQLTLIYHDFLENQIPEELMEKMVAISTDIEKTFNTFRGEVDGKTYSRNDVVKVLRESKNKKLRKNVWEAHKEVGSNVAEKLIELINLRNEAALKLGFDNYREMQLRLQEYDPEALDALFAELDEKTAEPFAEYKKKLDKLLAGKLKTKVEKLRPWHYADPFFQDAPQFTKINFDKYYEGKELVEIARTYYESFGLDPDPILEKSDLLPREGKSEHAFCFTIDRMKPDVRVLCNLQPTSRWMDTLLHELGHGFYDSYYEEDMPWRLREPAHIFTTEGVAQLFGEMTKNPNWLKEMLGLDEKEVEKVKGPTLKQRTLGRLIFARWSLVMYHFEKGLYENPEQDLNKLWWDLVEKYQQVTRPESRDKPDWATKDHIVAAPVYYHNYVLGQMYQDQLHEKLAELAGKEMPLEVILKDSPELGKYMIENVFKPGNSMPWNEFVEFSTGKSLSVDSYVATLQWAEEG